MQIRAIIKYPVKMLERTWLGDFAKFVRIAYTPLKETKPDYFVQSFRKPNLPETKARIRITTAKKLGEIKKRVLEHDFRP